MIRYIDKETGKRVVRISDMSFLRSRKVKMSWFSRHRLNRKYKKACRKADLIIVPDEHVAFDVHRFYFIPNDKIRVSDTDI